MCRVAGGGRLDSEGRNALAGCVRARAPIFPTGEDGRVATRPKRCEYVSVAVSLQQTIRAREVESDPTILVEAPVDDPCGKPSDAFIVGRDGRTRSYCSAH